MSWQSWCRVLGSTVWLLLLTEVRAVDFEKLQEVENKAAAAVSSLRNKAGTNPCFPNPCTVAHSTCVPKNAETPQATSNCVCEEGYKKSVLMSEMACKPINPCENIVEACGSSSPGIVCTYLGPGQHRCSCKKGYQGNGKTCSAINNCLNKTLDTACHPLALCQMTGPGKSTCLCPPGHRSYFHGRVCVPISNCKKSPSPCGRHSTCKDVGPGKHKCTCFPGYITLNKEAGECAPIDDCLKKPPVCGPHGVCESIAPGVHRCKCEENYWGTPPKCSPLNLCKAKPAVCRQRKHTRCQMIAPGQHQCVCKVGYREVKFRLQQGKKVPLEVPVCLPQNRCKAKQNDGCHKKATCIPSGPGERICVCNEGYYGNGKHCKPINRCLSTKSYPCHVNATCKYTGPGKFECKCNKDFYGNGIVCLPKDSCAETPYPCHIEANCILTGPGRHRCECKTGFSGDGLFCTRLSHCDVFTNSCGNRNAYCKPRPTNEGGPYCECVKGYAHSDSKAECLPLNDCGNKDSPACDAQATCIPTPSGHVCQCKNGLLGNGEPGNCQTNPCDKKPCGANSECVLNEDQLTYHCECLPGFREEAGKCIEINVCKDWPVFKGDRRRPCSPHATCTNLGRGNFSCKCNEGYFDESHIAHSGQFCKEIDACLVTPCPGPNQACFPTLPGQRFCLNQAEKTPPSPAQLSPKTTLNSTPTVRLSASTSARSRKAYKVGKAQRKKKQASIQHKHKHARSP